MLMDRAKELLDRNLPGFADRYEQVAHTGDAPMSGAGAGRRGVASHSTPGDRTPHPSGEPAFAPADATPMGGSSATGAAREAGARDPSSGLGRGVSWASLARRPRAGRRPAMAARRLTRRRGAWRRGRRECRACARVEARHRPCHGQHGRRRRVVRITRGRAGRLSRHRTAVLASWPRRPDRPRRPHGRPRWRRRLAPSGATPGGG